MASLWVLGLVLLAGCPEKSNKPSGPTANADASTKDSMTEKGAETASGEAGSSSEKSAVDLPNEKPSATQVSVADAPMGTASSDKEAWLENEDWTTKRLVALTVTGPKIIDLKVSVGGSNLATNSKHYASLILEEIRDGNVEMTWDELLDDPLVQSGWLGNLVAEDEQRGQILTMYDEGQDQQVTIDEFEKFLTRGLSRNEPLQISDIGNAPNYDGNSSPWGVIDSDEDYAVADSEREAAGELVGRFDFNGDSIVTAQEVSEAQARQSSTDSMNYRSMLDVSTLYVAHNLDSEDFETKNDAAEKLAKQLLSHYTFLEGVERSNWSSWSDAAWGALDSDSDGLLKRNELLAVASMPADVAIKVHFPDVLAAATLTIEAKESDSTTLDSDVESDSAPEPEESAAAEPEENSTDQDAAPESIESSMRALKHAALGEDENSNFRYVSQKDSGRLEIGSLVVEVRFEDAFAFARQQLLRDQLSAAVGNAQIQQVFQSQLQLEDGAFDLVDSNGNETLEDEEFARLWRWLSARQSSRLMARWMIAENPWFQLLDRNGDRRVGPKEREDASSVLAELDRDGDALVAPEEMPLMVRLELERTDSRLELGLFPQAVGPQDASESPSDWFSAMDINQDGFVSRVEFLGENDDFSNLDADSDGFVSRKEVY